MQQETIPRQAAKSAPPVPQSPTDPALFTEHTLRASLGHISERKFKELRAAGIVPDPLMLGPRSALDIRGSH